MSSLVLFRSLLSDVDLGVEFVSSGDVSSVAFLVGSEDLEFVHRFPDVALAAAREWLGVFAPDIAQLHVLGELLESSSQSEEVLGSGCVLARSVVDGFAAQVLAYRGMLESAPSGREEDVRAGLIAFSASFAPDLPL